MNRCNPSKKKSGYENRKRKKEMEEKVKKLPKLDAFFCIQMGNKSTAVENEVSTVNIFSPIKFILSDVQ